MSTAHTLAVQTHGRYLVEVPPGPGPHPMIVGFHGYGESADDQMACLAASVGDRPWIRVSVQALGRFYTRGDAGVVACWMTRQDRNLAITDNVAYVTAVVDSVRAAHDVSDTLVYAGFSQGAAMAYRAAAFAGPAAGLVVLAGDVPPDVVAAASSLPPVLVGRGAADKWYTAARAAEDMARLREAAVEADEVVFDAGHVWARPFSEAVGRFLTSLTTGQG